MMNTNRVFGEPANRSHTSYAGLSKLTSQTGKLVVHSRCCLIGIGILGLGLMGCSSAELATEGIGQAVYVDTETMQAIMSATAEELPAVNPVTGQRTLMPALYCPGCREWHPVPPPDQINRVPGATTCRETGAALTADGPWPE